MNRFIRLIISLVQSIIEMFSELVEGFQMAGNEDRVGAITVTIHLTKLPTKGILDDAINDVNGRNVIQDVVRVHIVDAHRLHAVVGEHRQDPDARFEWRREIIDGFFLFERTVHSVVCGRSEQQSALQLCIFKVDAVFKPFECASCCDCIHQDI